VGCGTVGCGTVGCGTVAWLEAGSPERPPPASSEQAASTREDASAITLVVGIDIERVCEACVAIEVGSYTPVRNPSSAIEIERC
jgi:hypothetical protein